MSIAQQLIRFSVVVAVGLALVGCGVGGPRRVIVKGRVVDGGKPLGFLTGDEFKAGALRVELTFYPLDASGKIAEGQSYSTALNQDSSFVVDGDGKGIPAGRYKVALAYRDMMFRDPKGQGDRWEGKFAPDKTPFTFDVQDPNKEVVIDIATGGGAAPTQEAQPGAKPAGG